MKAIPVTVLRKRRLFGIILTMLIFPGIIALPDFLTDNTADIAGIVVFIIFLFLYVLILKSYNSDHKNKGKNEHVLQSRISRWGVWFVFLGLSPLYLIALKPVSAFFPGQLLTDLNQEVVGFLSSAVLSESLLRDHEYIKYFQYVITGITYAVLHSYYISLIAVIISLFACSAAIILAFRFTVDKKVNNLILAMIQFVEAVPGILLLCIFLPIVTRIIYKLELLPETDLFLYVGITIGISCVPLMFRLVNNRIRQLKHSEFIINSRIHGVSEWKIIWYHIIWKNSFHQILTELIYIWGFALILEIGLCILSSSGNLQLPMIGRLHFSLGYLLSTEDSSKIFTLLFNLRIPRWQELFKIFVPFLLFISITSGLFFIQQGFQNEKEDDIRTIPLKSLTNFDKLLDYLASQVSRIFLILSVK